MIGFIVDTEFVWGFQARIVGLSKTSPSFYYPPPTTFLGALAEVVAKDKVLGEGVGRKLMTKLSENLLAIGVRPLNCRPIKYEDLNRVLTIKITSGVLYPNPTDFAKSFDSPARGKTILASFSDSPKLRWFVVFKANQIELDRKQIEINKDNFWKIHRIGSKESIVSIVDVKVFEPEKIEGEIKTTYSFPVTKNIEVIDEVWKRNWVYEVYINPFNFSNPIKDYIGGKNLLPFKIPIMHSAKGKYYCLVNGIGYKFGDEVLIGWLR